MNDLCSHNYILIIKRFFTTITSTNTLNGKRSLWPFIIVHGCFQPIESGAESYSELIGKLRKAKVNSSNGTAVFFSGYHPEAAKFVAEA